MNGSEEMSQLNSNNSMMLRNLLKSWNLESLLQLFKDEGITIEVLLMFKPHHIPQLLRNYQLGLQIRFEHHLEKWRRYIDKPMQTQCDSHACCCGCNHQNKKEIKSRSMPSSNMQNYATQSPYCDSYMPDIMPPCPKSLSPSSPAPSHTSFEARLPPKLTPAPPPALAIPPPIANLSIPTSTLTHGSTSTLTPTSTPAVSTALSLPTYSNSLNSAQSQRPSKNLVFSGDDYRSPHVSVNLILSVSQPRGQQLLDYYREHQCLTNTHRLQLINLIATYFDDNDYHLSLQTSYNMEREILKIFPNERLESFRTEKRGKIYVKFCNMKRYKALRDKPTTTTKRRRFGSLDGSLGAASFVAKDDGINTNDEDFSMGFENWEQPNPNNDIFIKTENLYEENYR